MGLEDRILKEKVKGIRRRGWVYTRVKSVLNGIFDLMDYKISVEGIDLIPEEGPVIIVFNHVSMVDPLFLMCGLRRPINSVGKKEIFGIPGWSWLITACGAYPIDRFNKDVGMNRRALIYSKELLELDEIVSLAPGATRGYDKIGKIRPKMLMALEKRVSCPIIACGMNYSDPKDIPRPGSSIKLCFSKYNIWEDGNLKSEETIAEELGQLLSDLSGLPYDPSCDILKEKYAKLMS